MSERRKLTKSERRSIYDKTRGHCAYCGCEIAINEMHIDHVESLKKGGADELSNMLPACDPCNNFKGALTVEQFRHATERWTSVLTRDNATYRNAVRFKLITENPQKITFYFERIREGQK